MQEQQPQSRLSLLRQQRQAKQAQTPPEAPPPLESPPEGLPVDPKPKAARLVNPIEVVKNAPASFLRNVKAVLWDLPVLAVQGLGKVFTDPRGAADDVVRLTKELPGAMKEDYARAYWHEAADEMEKDPFRFIGDAAGVASLGALGAGKVAATATGRLASGAGKVAKTLQRFEGMDPVAMTLSGGASLKGNPLLGWAGVDKNTDELRALNALLLSKSEKDANKAAARVFLKGLDKQSQSALIEAWANGDPDFITRMGESFPQAKKMYDLSKEWMVEDSTYWTETEGVVKRSEARQALIEARVRWNVQQGRIPNTPEAIEAFKADTIAKLDAGQINPTFFSILGDPKDGSWLSSITDPIYRDGVLGRAERRASKGQIPTDPYAILSNQIRASVSAKRKIELWRGAQEILGRKGLIKAVDGNTDLQALRKSGWTRLQGPFWEKYHDTFGRATNYIAEKIKAGTNPVSDAVNAAEEFKQIEMKASAVLENPVTELWAPEGVAKWLMMELSPNTADTILGKGTLFLSRMGGLMPYYKAIATVFNPRYWLGNAVGGAALSLLYGVHPQSLKYANKFRELLPAELQVLNTNELFLRDLNPMLRVAHNFKTYAAKVDAYFKNSIYVSEAINQEIKRGILNTGAKFFVAEAKVKAILSELNDSANSWRDNLIATTLARESLAKAGLSSARNKKDYEAKLVDYMRSQARGEGGKAAWINPNLDASYRGPGTEPVVMREDPLGRLRESLSYKPSKNIERLSDDGARVSRVNMPGSSRKPSIGQAGASARAISSGDMQSLGRKYNRNGAHEMLKEAYRFYRESMAKLRKEYGPSLSFILEDPIKAKQIAAQIKVHRDALNQARRAFRFADQPIRMMPNGDMVNRAGEVVGRAGYHPKAGMRVVRDAKPAEPVQFKDIPPGVKTELVSGDLTVRPPKGEIDPSLGIRNPVKEAEEAFLHFRHYPNQEAQSVSGQYGPLTHKGGERYDPTGGRINSDLYDISDMRTKLDLRAAEGQRAIQEVQQLQRDTLDLLGQNGMVEPGLNVRMRKYEQVVKAANDFFGSFNRLHPFERKVMSELVPFYSFAQTMTRLAFKLPFMFPIRNMWTLGLWRALQDMMEDQQSATTWTRHYTPIMTMEDGSFVAIRHGAWNPMNSVRMNPVGDGGIPSAWDIIGQNPLIKVVINARGQLSPKPITPGARATRLTNGEVWELGPMGWKRIVAAPTIWSQLQSLFPQAQLLDTLFNEGVANDRGRVYKGPDGKVLYPIGWQERAISLLVPATRYKPDDLERRERFKLNQIQRSFTRELRRASPERRDEIMEVFRRLRDDVDKQYLDFGGG